MSITFPIVPPGDQQGLARGCHTDLMDFTPGVTVAAGAAVIVIGVAGLLGSGVMTTTTVVQMVLPAMVIYGVIMGYIGMRFGIDRTA